MADDRPDVARYAWGKHLFDLRPLHIERNLLTPVGPLDEAPASPEGYCRYGYDEADRVVTIDHHVNRWRTDVDVLTHGDGVVEVEHTAGGTDGTRTQSRLELAGGVPSRWTWSTPRGEHEERYDYEHGRLVRARVATPGEDTLVFHIAWDGDELTRIRSELEGSGLTIAIFDRERKSRP